MGRLFSKSCFSGRFFSSLALALFLVTAACSSQDDSLARLSELSQSQSATAQQARQKQARAIADKANTSRPAAAPAQQRGPSSAEIPAGGASGSSYESTAITRAPLENLPAPSRPAPPASTDGKTQVALLLPLSGPNAAMGQAMLNAAQLAVFELAPAHFELMPRDTGKTKDSAAAAAQDALASGAQLLIGPLFATDVAAVKPVLQTTGASMLALSTDVSLADQAAFVMGFAPAPQVERVTAYAAREGATRFAAVIPNSAYGKLVRKTFESAVEKHGGTVVAVVSPQKIGDLAAHKDALDAVFLPLDGQEIQQAAGALAALHLDRGRVRLLGTGLWDEPSPKPDILNGAVYAASEPESRMKFMENYKKTYQKYPPRLATLAYDATALAAILSTRGFKFDRAALTNPNGFSGIDGIFRLRQDGQAERGLAILAIAPNGPEIIDPAPSTFAR